MTWEEDNTSKATWFIAGAALGATLALLFAPAAGEVTRRKIRRSAEKGKDRLAESGRDLMDKGRGLYEKGKDLADDAAELFEKGRKLVEG
jgi:gas vesicle protein